METLSFSADKAARYQELLPQLDALFEGEPELIANLANATAAIRECVPAASWVGFYLRRGDQLVLGPFQGKIACVRIAMGRGVCGTAAAERRTLVVADVEEFPGHIACDAGSRSEIVVPIIAPGDGDRGHVVAVLDVDSYQVGAFDDDDAAGLEAVAARLARLAW
ncbi:MAG: GAF domain-containing protein [Kofleriaceae bacterium]|nr:GAF domain-containing protein [Myxococcales bacterium]MCB9561096.1 GAF domain-containing protein [Kofleriaceae bacterium]MCB9571295.1 GAF domain-containing protein [Kofleriaceae bacterium]